MAEQKPYAIIRTGSKQYRDEEGDVIEVELLGVEENQPVEFSEVLFHTDGAKQRVGSPLIQGCSVKGEMLAEVSGPKVIAYKYKRRKNYHRKVGHRQKYSQVKITAIEG